MVREKRRVFSDPLSSVSSGKSRFREESLNTDERRSSPANFGRRVPSSQQSKTFLHVPSRPQSRRKLRHIRRWNEQVCEKYHLPPIAENLYCQIAPRDENNTQRSSILEPPFPCLNQMQSMPIPPSSSSLADKIWKAITFKNNNSSKTEASSKKSTPVLSSMSVDDLGLSRFANPKAPPHQEGVLTLQALLEKHGKDEWHVRLDSDFATFFTVPNAFSACCDEVIARGLDLEGIFRKSGEQQRIRELYMNISKFQFRKFSSLSTENIHNICGVIKKFLRDLPEPLLTFELCDHFYKVSTLALSDKEKAGLTIRLLRLLPQPNLHLIAALCTFFVDFVLDPYHAKSNLQSRESLSVIFGNACLLWSMEERLFTALPPPHSTPNLSRKPLSPFNSTSTSTSTSTSGSHGSPSSLISSPSSSSSVAQKLIIPKRNRRITTNSPQQPCLSPSLMQIHLHSSINNVLASTKRGQVVMEFLLKFWKSEFADAVKQELRPGAIERDDRDLVMP